MSQHTEYEVVVQGMQRFIRREKAQELADEINDKLHRYDLTATVQPVEVVEAENLIPD